MPGKDPAIIRYIYSGSMMRLDKELTMRHVVAVLLLIGIGFSAAACVMRNPARALATPAGATGIQIAAVSA